jgi:hypothetical protein
LPDVPVHSLPTDKNINNNNNYVSNETPLPPPPAAVSLSANTTMSKPPSATISYADIAKNEVNGNEIKLHQQPALPQRPIESEENKLHFPCLLENVHSIPLQQHQSTPKGGTSQANAHHHVSHPTNQVPKRPKRDRHSQPNSVSSQRPAVIILNDSEPKSHEFTFGFDIDKELLFGDFNEDELTLLDVNHHVDVQSTDTSTQSDLGYQSLNSNNNATDLFDQQKSIDMCATTTEDVSANPREPEMQQESPTPADESTILQPLPIVKKADKMKLRFVKPAVDLPKFYHDSLVNFIGSGEYVPQQEWYLV